MSDVKTARATHGTLTAEQVRKCVRVGACDHGLWDALDEDTDWQAIADELNAELGNDRHPYKQRITGDGSDWGEIMRDAYDSLMATACESCTPEQMEQLADYIRAELGSGTLTAEQVPEAARGHYKLYMVRDEEYEVKMDALLCRLTNGKWSKSRAYDLDFMVSCIEEEFEAAELGSGTCEQVLTDCDDGLMPPFTAHCSACGAEWGFTQKYCHNCGAKCTGTRDERKAVER